MVSSRAQSGDARRCSGDAKLRSALALPRDAGGRRLGRERQARRTHLAATLLAVGAVALSASGSAQRALYLSHNALGAALIAHALFLSARGWRGDLVETRRRLRGPILATVSIYALAVIAVQTGELFVGSAQALSPIAAAALLLLGLLSLAAFARMDPSLFGASAAAPALATPQIIVPPPERVNSSTTQSMRIFRPSWVRSSTKS